MRSYAQFTWLKFRDWYDAVTSIYELANVKSEPRRLMWLNRNISNKALDAESLNHRLSNFLLMPNGIAVWMRDKLIKRFYEKGHTHS